MLNCSKFEKNVIFGKKVVAILNQNCRISIKIYSKLTAQNIKFLKQFCQFFKKSSDFWNKNSDFCTHMLKIVDFWIKSCQISIKIDRSKSKIYENFVNFWKKRLFLMDENFKIVSQQRTRIFNFWIWKFRLKWSNFTKKRPDFSLKIDLIYHSK